MLDSRHDSAGAWSKNCADTLVPYKSSSVISKNSPSSVMFVSVAFRAAICQRISLVPSNAVHSSQKL
eukprot:COSAG04_NODE_728_length_10781_cov_15.102134_7_plen_67_part_00